MKNIKEQKHIKQITYIFIILILCNFILPNYSYAVSAEGGGSLVEPITKFICFIPDVVNGFLQDMFISTDAIDETGEYKILYSSATIFAGEIPALDIDFIGQTEEAKINTRNVEVISGKGTVWELTNEEFNENYKNKYGSIYTAMINLIQNGNIRGNDGYIAVRLNGETFNSEYVTNINQNAEVSLEEISKNLNITYTDQEISYTIRYFDGSTPDKTDTVDKDNLADTKFCINNACLYVENVIYNGKQYDTLTLYYAKYEANAADILGQSFYSIIAYDGYIREGENGDEIENATYNYMQVTVEEDELGNIDYNKEYKYTSFILQPIIATWYNVLRRIALVGLLSVLVYLGIRIIFFSGSAKDKAKYKKMLKDWLIALCMLFVLHYVMSITIAVVDDISGIINTSVIGENGEDVLISAVRNEIADSDSLSSAITYILIYCVLTVYTVVFTIQYLRRVIYLAFLTMIAPLITLTYPLDKIKDSKAQAFDMWIKDYIFFSLIQVLHLLLYYIFVGSAIDLNNQGNWLYAIVAIGFLTKAEKLMKKMFGFEKSKSMGALAAGATGALVMNAINAIPRGKPNGSGGKTHSGGTQGGNSSGKGVRTATVNPLSALQDGTYPLDSRISPTGSLPTEVPQPKGTQDTRTPDKGTQDTGTQDTKTPDKGTQDTGTQAKGTHTKGTQDTGTQDTKTPDKGTQAKRTQTKGTQTKGTQAKGTPTKDTQDTGTQHKGTPTESTPKKDLSKSKETVGSTTKPKRNIGNGVKSLAGRYLMSGAKNLAKGFVGGTGALIGFSAGVAQGDISSAIGGAFAGGKAGSGLIDWGASKTSGIGRTFNEARDTFNEGAYGKEIAQNMKFDREFRRSDAYKALKRNPNFSDKDIQKMLDAGITDPKKMDKILKKSAKHPRKYAIDKAIAYNAMAETCPEGILYDNSKFIRYCRDKEILISPEDVQELRKNIVEFK